jgi:hypothetical protein
MDYLKMTSSLSGLPKYREAARAAIESERVEA